MPSSDQQGFPDGCYLCDGGAGYLHHISYIPEKVVLVCSACHGEIHSMGYDRKPIHPELLPDRSRGEWQEQVWDGGWIPRPEPHQIDWDSDWVGTVER